MSKNKIGIICNIYKLSKYKEALEKNGFKDYSVHNYGNLLMIIKINTSIENQSKISLICNKLEHYFKTLRN